MIQASGPLGAATYRYNGVGQRVTKILSSGGARHYLYADDGDSLLGEYAQAAAGASASPVYEIVYLEGTPVLALNNGAVYYIQVDHLNAPRLVKNSASAVVWRWTSDAYGVGTADQNPSGEGVFEFNLRFPGQQYDVETGLYYNNARYYDPHTGRYISSDPIGLDGGVNTYAYVGNSPTTAVDPTGEFAFVLPFAVPPVVTYIAGTAAAAGFVAIVAKNPTVKAIVNAAASKVPRGAKEYVTYERYNASTGQYYNGRTSGYGDPNSIASSVLFTPRHCLLSLEGFGPVNFDRSTTNYYAIRGREQQRIDYRGGAMSVGGNSRNKINGVADFNLRRPQYMDAAIMEFGALPDNSPIRPRRQ